jgi:UDP-N-acetylmuramoyl-tripeptide--D-alanyl-D-alanine ligase
MIDYPLDLVARVLEARLEGRFERRARGVSIDSRSVQEGDLFFALPGEKTDGHNFLSDAFKRGAVGAVVAPERIPRSFSRSGALLEVPDPLLALGAFAAWHRDRFPVRVIAVTGSVGKTTTKDFIAGIVSKQWTTLKSPASYNAEIGVPLTLLQLRKEHQMAVVEMAMRGPGQIRYLARLARPEVGVITNIGSSHLELLGSREAIAEAKAELLDYLPNGGAVVLNIDDNYFDFMKSRVPPGVAIHSFGVERAKRESVTGSYLGPTTPGERGAAEAVGARFTIRGAQGQRVAWVTLPLLGRHNMRNALAAAAVAQALGVSLPRICRGLGDAETSAMRMAVRRLKDETVVLDDAYNASSPEAMLAALEVLGELTALRKIAVLGSMLELGEASELAHEEVGEAVAKIRPSTLITVGAEAERIAKSAVANGIRPEQVIACANNDEAAQRLRARRRPGDVILVKGSRGMAMESIVKTLLDDVGT